MALDRIKDGKYSLAEDGGGRVGNDARWREILWRGALARVRAARVALGNVDASTTNKQLAARSLQLAAPACTIVGEVQHRGLPGRNRLIDVDKRCKPATSA
jgi:hypothetical protein